MTTARVVIDGMGARVRVAVTGDGADGFVAQLREAWSRCVSDSDDARATVKVTLAEGEDPWDRLERVTRQVTLALLERQVGNVMLFHAGGVSHPVTGRSVGYVAPSFTGKTSLTVELGRHFGYLSDETIAVGEDLSILPYPKPLSVRDPDGGPRRELSPDGLGLRRPGGAPYLAALLYLDRRDDHEGPPEVEVVDAFDAAVLLGPQTSSLSLLPAGLHRLDALLRRVGGLTRVTYCEASSLLPLVTGLIEPPEEASDDGGDGELVRLVAPADRLVGDGETLLLYKERLLRLGPLGAEIVDLAVRPIAVGALADRLTERLGAPDGVDARAATADAVERLIADGVLERVDSSPL